MDSIDSISLKDKHLYFPGTFKKQYFHARFMPGLERRKGYKKKLIKHLHKLIRLYPFSLHRPNLSHYVIHYNYTPTFSRPIS